MNDAFMARLDTAALAIPGRPTRALLVANEGDAPFDGVAALRVDFRTRAAAPVTVLAADGSPVAARIVDETLGPVEADGRRRWRFVLEFRAAVPPRTVVGYSAAWDASESAPLAADGSGPRLTAIERECVPGVIPLPALLSPAPPAELSSGV